MLESLNHINTSHLNLEQPNTNSVFYPEHYITDEHWSQVANQLTLFNTIPISHNLRAILTILDATKILNPTLFPQMLKLSNLPNFLSPNFEEILNKRDLIQYLSQLKAVAPELLPTDKLPNYKLGAYQQFGIIAQAFGDEHLVALLRLFPDLQNKVIFNQDHKNQLKRQIAIRRQRENAQLSIAGVIMHNKILNPKSGNLDMTDLEQRKLQQQYLKGLGTEPWIHTFKYAIRLKALAATQIYITENGLEFIMPSLKLTEKTHTMPEKRKF